MEGLLEIISNVWNQGLLGIGVTEIIVSALIFIGGAIVRAFFVGSTMARLEKLTSDTESEVDDVLLESLRKPLGYIPLTISIYIIAVYLPLSGIAELFATNLIKAMIAFTIFTALANSVTPIFQAFTSSTVLTESMTKWLERAAKVIIWVVGIGIIFDIFGIQIGPLVAGLGLFSVAVALGAQDFFKNLISGLLIIGENRFQPGDRIEVPGHLHGIVEDIGFRSTLIRMFDTAPTVIGQIIFGLSPKGFYLVQDLVFDLDFKGQIVGITFNDVFQPELTAELFGILLEEDFDLGPPFLFL